MATAVIASRPAVAPVGTRDDVGEGWSGDDADVADSTDGADETAGGSSGAVGDSSARPNLGVHVRAPRVGAPRRVREGGGSAAGLGTGSGNGSGKGPLVGARY